MKIKFLKMNPDARMPEKAHQSDFGYDVYAVSEKEIAPGVWQYGLGFGLQIERGNEVIFKGDYIDSLSKTLDTTARLDKSPISLSIDIRPRSSVWKTGMVMCNCEPTVDEAYTGEIKLNFYHVMPDMPRYKVGDKIAQCKIGMALPMEFIEVQQLNKTDRGDGSFGSTGK